MSDHRYTIAHTEIVFEQLDDDLIVLDLRSGRYFGFNEAGAATWSALMDGASARDCIAAGMDEAGTQAFVETILADGLVVAAAEPATALSAEQAASLRAAAGAPSIECFDDLADLMLADPIHEVDDQFGWPHRPADA